MLIIFMCDKPISLTDFSLGSVSLNSRFYSIKRLCNRGNILEKGLNIFFFFRRILK